MRPFLHALTRTAALAAALPVLAANALAAVLRAAGGRTTAAGDGGLSVVIPYPPGDRSGGARAIQGLLRTLEGGYAVHIVPLYALSPAGGRVRAAMADWITHALPMPVHCRPFALSGDAVRARIPEGRPLVIEFLSGAVFLLFGRRPRTRIILREHEPLCRRLWSERRTARGIDRAFRPLQALLAWLATTAVYAKVDRVVALTPEDAAFLRRAFPFFAARVTDVPVSLDLPAPASSTDPGDGRREILFLGNLYHRPNVDGLRWWMREVAPRLGDGWTLHLCGLDAPLDDDPLPPSPVRVVRHGFVADVAGAFADVRIAVAPLVSGGGVRMKNLELAALGKAIVTTSVGNEGIGFAPGRDTLLADGADAMADALRRLAADPDRAARMGARARAHVAARFGHAAALARYREIIDGAPSPAAVPIDGSSPDVEAAAITASWSGG